VSLNKLVINYIGASPQSTVPRNTRVPPMKSSNFCLLQVRTKNMLMDKISSWFLIWKFQSDLRRDKTSLSATNIPPGSKDAISIRFLLGDVLQSCSHTILHSKWCRYVGLSLTGKCRVAPLGLSQQSQRTSSTINHYRPIPTNWQLRSAHRTESAGYTGYVTRLT
jgi:hypothetical protein